MKFSTFIYLIALILLAGWLVKSYFDLDVIDTKLKSLSQKSADLVYENVLDQLKKGQEIKAEKYRRNLDGIFVDSKNLTNPYVAAIVIENLLEARPQAGLDKAGLVYEVAAEGGITRFLAIFGALDDIERIGPIRSARPYLLDWGEEFGQPIFLHVGGSPDALAKIDRRKLINLDEFFWRYDYYQRVSDKAQPHNVYTTPELLQKIKDNYLITEGKYAAWKFKDDADLEERGKVDIKKIDFSTATYGYEGDYTVSWKYDKENNEYIRWQGNYAHQVESGAVIKTKNIAIMYTDEQMIDEIGRLKIRTLEEGRAQVFQDGQAIEGKWRKDNITNRTRFYNSADEEIKFNAGQTWIEVAPIKNNVVFN